MLCLGASEGLTSVYFFQTGLLWVYWSVAPGHAPARKTPTLGRRCMETPSPPGSQAAACGSERGDLDARQLTSPPLSHQGFALASPDQVPRGRFCLSPDSICRSIGKVKTPQMGPRLCCPSQNAAIHFRLRRQARAELRPPLARPASMQLSTAHRSGHEPQRTPVWSVSKLPR